MSEAQQQPSRLKAVILYLNEMTAKNPEYTFTSKTISEAYDITLNNAGMILKRLHNYSKIKPVSIIGYKKNRGRGLITYKFTNSGMRYANRLKNKIMAEGMII